jgi:WD40 repeat protein
MSWIGKLLGVSAKNPERPKDAVGEVSPPAVSSSATDLVLSSVFGLAFSSDGKMLASGHRTGEVRLWSSQPRELVHTFRGHSNGVVSLAFSPDGQKLATGSYDATARIWDVASGGEMGRVNADADNSTMRVRVSFSPDGALLATRNLSTTLRQLGGGI